jgi:regulator of sigma E protease
LLRADNKELQRFGVRTLLDVANAEKVTVLRNGEEVQLTMQEGLMENLLKDKEGFAVERIPAVVYQYNGGKCRRSGGTDYR